MPRPDTGELDPLYELRQDVKTILAHVGGSYDDNGEHHPGLSHRVKRLEDIVHGARTWALGVAAAVVTTVAGAWAMLGAGPHQGPPGHP